MQSKCPKMTRDLTSFNICCDFGWRCDKLLLCVRFFNMFGKNCSTLLKQQHLLTLGAFHSIIPRQSDALFDRRFPTIPDVCCHLLSVIYVLIVGPQRLSLQVCRRDLTDLCNVAKQKLLNLELFYGKDFFH